LNFEKQNFMTVETYKLFVCTLYKFMSESNDQVRTYALSLITNFKTTFFKRINIFKSILLYL
jgi:hypothetical protein